MNWTQEQFDAAISRLSTLKEVMSKAGAIPQNNRRKSTGGTPERPPVRKRGMNQWEKEFAADLEMQKQMGSVLWWGFETISIRLAAGARYTPDFCVINKFGLKFFEVKGFFREAALVRIKVAAEIIPIPIEVYRKRKVSEGGGWEQIRAFN